MNNYLPVFMLLVSLQSLVSAQMINGDFEMGTTGQYAGSELEGWRLLYWQEGIGNFYLVNDVKYLGDQSLKVEVVSAGDNPRKVYVSNWQITGESVSAGDLLTVRFFARSETRSYESRRSTTVAK